MPVVLVVENEAVVRLLAESILADAGHATLSAGNTDEAMALLQAPGTTIDVLLTDLDLGEDGRNGFDLARRALALRPGLRVLYTTGMARTDGMATLAVAGSGWLAKPYDMHALLEAVRSLTAAG